MPFQFLSRQTGAIAALMSALVLIASPVSAQTESCENAVVPNSQPLKDETTAFYGECVDNQAKTGLVVWKQKGIPFNISCLQDGKFSHAKDVMNAAFIARESRCLQHLNAMPGGCSKNGYRGQCNAAGAPEGVGFMYTRTSSSVGGSIADHNLTWGMFKDGKPEGHVKSFTIHQCGMLGCTGGETGSVGYFVAGSKQFDCSGGLLGCLEKKEQLAREAASADTRRRQQEATFQSQLASSNPQAMYLAAGSYARDGDWSKAQALYNRIISKFPSSNWAVKASDQLDAQRRSSDAAARQSDETDQRQRERQRDKDDASRGCHSRISACENSCPNIKYNSSSVVFACKERCRSLCTP